METKFKVVCAAVLVASIHASAAMAQQRPPERSATSRSDDTVVVACVATIERLFKEDGTVAIRSQLIGERTAISFYPDRMAYVGTVPQLTAAQARNWEPVLDLLRDAARQRVKVEIRIDKASKRIEALEVRYHVPC
jgi:DNA helicase HerA-like ATPase